jgi:hypothetical protein
MKKAHGSPWVRALVLFTFLGIPVIAPAIDVGDPIYRGDLNKNSRLEIIYERYDREAELEFSALGGKDTEQANADVDLLYLRWTLLQWDSVAAHLDLGVLDDDEADSTPLLLGTGLRFRAYQSDRIQVSLFTAGHYIPNYDLEDRTLINDNGQPIEFSGDREFYEVSAGALVSFPTPIDHTTLIPYAGVAYSVLGGASDFNLSSQALGLSIDTDVDIEEDSPILVVVGLSCLIREGFSARIEGRLAGDESISGSFGFAF